MEKAVIKNLESDSNEEINVMFNPSEYQLVSYNSWYESPVSQGKPSLNYGGAGGRTLYMQLFYALEASGGDSESPADVSVEINKLQNLMEPGYYGDEKKEFRPPYLLFTWGSFTFNCVLKELSQRYTSFDETGVPTRAIVRVAFAEVFTKGSAV